MTKIKISIILLVLGFCMPFFAFSQDDVVISEAEWGKITPLIETEKWADAEKLAAEYLQKFQTPEQQLSDDAGMVRYMYVQCLAGLLGEKVYTKEACLGKLKTLEGKNIITPPRIFQASKANNKLGLTDDKKNWACSFAGKNNTIYTIETYEMKESLYTEDVSIFEGQELRINAIIKKIDASQRVDINLHQAEVF